MMSIFFCVALDIIIYPAPVKSPFPGERGQGDRGSELEVCFKNRLFLQSERTAVKLSVNLICNFQRLSSFDFLLLMTEPAIIPPTRTAAPAVLNTIQPGNALLSAVCPAISPFFAISALALLPLSTGD